MCVLASAEVTRDTVCVYVCACVASAEVTAISTHIFFKSWNFIWSRALHMVMMDSATNIYGNGRPYNKLIMAMKHDRCEPSALQFTVCVVSYYKPSQSKRITDGYSHQ